GRGRSSRHGLARRARDCATAPTCRHVLMSGQATGRVEIQRPLEEVFEFVANFENEVRWKPGVVLEMRRETETSGLGGAVRRGPASGRRHDDQPLHRHVIRAEPPRRLHVGERYVRYLRVCYGRRRDGGLVHGPAHARRNPLEGGSARPAAHASTAHRRRVGATPAPARSRSDAAPRSTALSRTPAVAFAAKTWVATMIDWR